MSTDTKQTAAADKPNRTPQAQALGMVLPPARARAIGHEIFDKIDGYTAEMDAAAKAARFKQKALREAVTKGEKTEADIKAELDALAEKVRDNSHGTRMAEGTPIAVTAVLDMVAKDVIDYAVKQSQTMAGGGKATVKFLSLFSGPDLQNRMFYRMFRNLGAYQYNEVAEVDKRKHQAEINRQKADFRTAQKEALTKAKEDAKGSGKNPDEAKAAELERPDIEAQKLTYKTYVDKIIGEYRTKEKVGAPAAAAPAAAAPAAAAPAAEEADAGKGALIRFEFRTKEGICECLEELLDLIYRAAVTVARGDKIAGADGAKGKQGSNTIKENHILIAVRTLLLVTGASPEMIEHVISEAVEKTALNATHKKTSEGTREAEKLAKLTPEERAALKLAEDKRAELKLAKDKLKKEAEDAKKATLSNKLQLLEQQMGAVP